MKKLTLTAGAILVAGAAAIFGGCDNSANTQSGSFLYYENDAIPTGQEDTSDQTLADLTPETVDPTINMLARQYDAQTAAKAQAAAARVCRGYRRRRKARRRTSRNRDEEQERSDHRH